MLFAKISARLSLTYAHITNLIHIPKKKKKKKKKKKNATLINSLHSNLLLFRTYLQSPPSFVPWTICN